MLTAEELEQRTHAVRKVKWYKILYVQVIIAILIGIALGYFYPQAGEAMKPFGDAFIKLVKMIIAPVIFLTVTTGIADRVEVRTASGEPVQDGKEGVAAKIRNRAQEIARTERVAFSVAFRRAEGEIAG